MGELVDPITVSVIQHRLEAIVQKMGKAMLRTSYSQILNSSRDFSTALCDAEGRLVAQAEHVPIHVGAIPWAVRSVRQFFGDRAPSVIAARARHPFVPSRPAPSVVAGADRSDATDGAETIGPRDRVRLRVSVSDTGIGIPPAKQGDSRHEARSRPQKGDTL